MSSEGQHAVDAWPFWHLSNAELCERYVALEREVTRMQARAAATLAQIDRRAASRRHHGMAHEGSERSSGRE